jgi:alkylation response protein AidB-like acyl-CoA dehydrogenase
MNVALDRAQLAWQEKARAFAQEELKPRSLERDRIADPQASLDWEIIHNGSKLGFRTAVVPREWGGHGIDAVTQVAGHAAGGRSEVRMAPACRARWRRVDPQLRSTSSCAMPRYGRIWRATRCSG